MTRDELSCRICFDDDGELKKYCNCKAGLYHKKCLKSWIITKPKGQEKLRCEVCLYKYQNISYEYKYNCFANVIPIIIFLFLNIILFFSLVYPCQFDELCDEKSIYTIFGIFVCFIFLFALFIRNCIMKNSTWGGEYELIFKS
tara:strand:- start:39 stop:467 length:429 start_codon:yes stop_codon:yes gene_type:complete